MVGRPSDEQPGMIAQPPRDRGASPSAIAASIDVTSTPEAAYALFCQVDKWPVWLSFVRTAKRADAGDLAAASEVVVRSSIPGDAEELYEVERLIEGYAASFVGAFSTRRRIEFRVERRAERCRATVRLDYPAYGGPVGAFLDRVTARRRLVAELDSSLVRFKHLVEFAGDPGTALRDF